MGTRNGTSRGEHLSPVDTVFACLLFVGKLQWLKRS